MAHHQHHGAEYDAQVSRSLQTRPTSAAATHMPVISEDDLMADPDEPPDDRNQSFTKTFPHRLTRQESLLTKALHTDSESHDEDIIPQDFYDHLPSVSSTCSNISIRSNGDFTSDDGRVSPSTRASSPSSPRSVSNIPKIYLNSLKLQRQPTPPQPQVEEVKKPAQETTKAATEPTVEATLGRKRCITFACGGKDTSSAPKQKALDEAPPEPPKRQCSIKFVCPFTASKLSSDKTEPLRTSRRLSPAPSAYKAGSPTSIGRRHRDSDATIRNESPKTPTKASPSTTSARPKRRLNNNSDLERTDACRFHEFASSDEDVEDWLQESTCHRSRLTVSDTLKKENDIRRLAEEADEEEELDMEEAEEDDEELSDDEVSDAGFQTDDEDGFAESDDDSDNNSDYEWWAPRRSRTASPYVGHDVVRPMANRTLSDSSEESSDAQISPKEGRGRHSRKRSKPVTIRPGTPELPDSTDFVCGTLDEDRPLEQAYVSCMQLRKAAKHITTPQDIDPTFPTSDPELDSDDDEDKLDNEADDKVDESDQHFFMHGKPDNVDAEEPRGRRTSPAPRRSPHLSPNPKRLRSPPPPTKKQPAHRSPAPKALFNHSSPQRLRSPPPNRLTSPPPSRRASATASPSGAISFGLPFIGQRSHEPTYTASLPRSPHPFCRRHMPKAAEDDYSDDEDGEESEHAKPYARGAIDIAQGLEKKRLKRREKFYKQYLKKEEKKKSKRPQPGKGAERMRQVGLECAELRGTRMLSI